MKREQLKEIVIKLKEAHTLQEEAYQIATANDDAFDDDFRICDSALKLYSELIRIHVFSGLERLAKQLVGDDYCLTIITRTGDSKYPIEKEFVHDGVRYFQLYGEKEELDNEN